MNTPIYDFISDYNKENKARFHMPGHKGKTFLGSEALDITEVSGADVLYSPTGIIAESESNATRLFGTAHTYYSTEGSSLVIKAMLGIIKRSAREGERQLIIASRNAHKSFFSAAALLDIDVLWLSVSGEDNICKSTVDMEELDALLSDTNAGAVYITSPDYLGNIADIRGISKVCKRYEVPLIVDNAHGAYLRFLGESRHPIDEGADMCSDSAHKTLPVLTGGAYLHISDTSPFKETFCSSARDMLSLFASTSPSYLTLASLDLCNKYVADGYRDTLAETVRRIGEIKEELSSLGFSVMDTEPLKLVINTADFGYSGREISRLMSCSGIELEYADGDYAVLMITPQNTEEDFNAFLSFMRSLKRKSPIKSKEIFTYKPKSAMSFREAYFRDRETVATDKALGRICASLSVSCPPAIPIVALGEVIDGEAVALLRRYGVDTVEVVK